ncbi:hypothetical protein DPMN_107118 [Dreissena polymorpha]|uniref:Uncharacterized protein n=1 Tax=Dreissena polymorpha TaxID=45954 RepID=A0A9D4K6J7_DREPO|nr:hypothetical protein DPMN_107118 [Dreissena polymorpha]
MVALPELRMDRIYFNDLNIERLHQVHNQQAKTTTAILREGKLHHFSDEAGKAIVVLRVFAQELL